MNRKGTRDGRSFGARFKELRIRLGKTLRLFCAENDLDPGNMSKLERGILPPPQSQDILTRYASALKLKKGSADWYEFFDLAAAEAGMIPKDLQDQEVLHRLPVLFRTIRSTKLSNKQLDELIERLRSE